MGNSQHQQREQVLAWAEEQGCEIRRPKGGCKIGVYFQGRRVGTVPQTSTCPHAWKNAKAFIGRNMRAILQERARPAAPQ